MAKIDAWSSIVLLILFFIFMVSGYMITRGLISRYWGILLHTQLDLPIMAVFTVHFTLQLRFFLAKRKLVGGRFLNLITLLVSLLSIDFIVYLDLFF